MRAAAALHVRRTQFILPEQRRLIPNRPIAISKKELLDNLELLKTLEADGILKVCLPTGQRVNLKTLEAETVPEMQFPNKPLDSAHNDPPPGKAFVKTDLSIDVATAPTEPVQTTQPADLPQELSPGAHVGEKGPVYPHPLFLNPGDRMEEVPEENAAKFINSEQVEQVQQSEIENAFGGPGTGVPEEEAVDEPVIEEKAPEEVEDSPTPRKRGRRK